MASLLESPTVKQQGECLVDKQTELGYLHLLGICVDCLVQLLHCPPGRKVYLCASPVGSMNL